MNHVDRSAAFTASGRSIIGDRAATAPPPPPVDIDLTDDDFVPAGLKAWAGRSDNGIHVQGLVDSDGTTYVTVVFGRQCETREIAREKALDAFLHPFAYGFSVTL
jgi:hypothetical protein